MLSGNLNNVQHAFMPNITDHNQEGSNCLPHTKLNKLNTLLKSGKNQSQAIKLKEIGSMHSTISLSSPILALLEFVLMGVDQKVDARHI
jgi:hypothetical protein